MGVKVDPEKHAITVAGRPVAIRGTRSHVLPSTSRRLRHHHADPHAGRTVMDLLRDVDVPRASSGPAGQGYGRGR